MTPLKVVPGLLRVASVLLAYRLDELVDAAHLFRPLKLLRPFAARPRVDVSRLPRGERLRLAMTELGPIFVKAGQVLSTRRDLVPADIADEGQERGAAKLPGRAFAGTSGSDRSRLLPREICRGSRCDRRNTGSNCQNAHVLRAQETLRAAKGSRNG